jgi:hypothetical protein
MASHSRPFHEHSPWPSGTTFHKILTMPMSATNHKLDYILEMDTHIDQMNNTTTEQELLAMKAMISEVKRNPSLIHQTFDLKSPPQTPVQSEVKNENQIKPSSIFSMTEYEQTVSSRITEQDLNHMKVAIQEIRCNPSLIYQRFDLPWELHDPDDILNLIDMNFAIQEMKSQTCDLPLYLYDPDNIISPSSIVQTEPVASRRSSFPRPPFMFDSEATNCCKGGSSR